MRTAEADYGLTSQAFDRPGAGMTNPDDRLRVSFSMQPEEDKEASAKEGRPIYVEREYVTILVPGERDIVNRRAWQKDYDRFPRQYAAFKNKQSQDHASGTPLKLVTWLSQAQVKELEYFNCMTVEQLAGLSDTHAYKFQSLQKLKQLANDYLKASKEQAPLTAMRAELDASNSDRDILRRQVQELAAKVEELSKRK